MIRSDNWFDIKKSQAGTYFRVQLQPFGTVGSRRDLSAAQQFAVVVGNGGVGGGHARVECHVERASEERCDDDQMALPSHDALPPSIFFFFFFFRDDQIERQT